MYMVNAKKNLFLVQHITLWVSWAHFNRRSDAASFLHLQTICGGSFEPQWDSYVHCLFKSQGWLNQNNYNTVFLEIFLKDWSDKEVGIKLREGKPRGFSRQRLANSKEIWRLCQIFTKRESDRHGVGRKRNCERSQLANLCVFSLPRFYSVY